MGDLLDEITRMKLAFDKANIPKKNRVVYIEGEEWYCPVHGRKVTFKWLCDVYGLKVKDKEHKKKGD